MVQIIKVHCWAAGGRRIGWVKVRTHGEGEEIARLAALFARQQNQQKGRYTYEDAMLFEAGAKFDIPAVEHFMLYVLGDDREATFDYEEMQEKLRDYPMEEYHYDPLPQITLESIEDFVKTHMGNWH